VALLAQFLGFLAVIPDGRIFQLLAYFLKALLFAFEVKDTSGVRWSG
jgi:hypothetical protein